MTIKIRKASYSDLDSVLSVECAAFGHDKEAGLVSDLLEDLSASPALSLLAFDGDQAVGHILFTRALLEGAERTVSVSLLAPLAVVPQAQKKGIGGRLIDEGVKRLKASGVDLVFVLGHPEYYPRHGFQPAGVHGLNAPYPIPDIHADAWMVQELGSGVIGSVHGKVVCADALNRPEYWRE